MQILIAVAMVAVCVESAAAMQLITQFLASAVDCIRVLSVKYHHSEVSVQLVLSLQLT